VATGERVGKNAVMAHADLTTADWARCSDDEAQRVAERIAGETGLRLVEVRWHEFAGRRHRLAVFDRDGLLFSLVPGGRVLLGYDGSRFQPTPAQAASYAESAGEYGPPSVAEYLDGVTSPQREVVLPAMLVAVEPFEPCAHPLPVDDPRVLDLVAKAGPAPRAGSGIMTFTGDGDGIEVRFDAGGRVAQARTKTQVGYDEAVERVDRLGLRLSTPDEWEYACGAGAPTLFRWGDDTPDSGYPYDHRSGRHREPNLWGLAIGQDPYRHEWTTEPTIVCGGDGGGATCGGDGFFVGWTTIATAYRNTEFGEWLNSDDGYVDELLVRPVIDLR
jgi:hypothetical protein